MKKIFSFPVLSFALLLVFPLALSGKDVFLMKNGKAASVIYVNKNAIEAEKHAAKELSYFLGKIAGGKGPEIVSGKKTSLYPITFVINKNDKEIKDDGFRLAVTEKGTVISAKHERGLIYGSYEIVKRYGGIRFLVPGEDGIYFEAKKDIAAKVSDTVYNPSSCFRTFFFESCNTNSLLKDTWDWMLRNNMYPELTPGQLKNPKIAAFLKCRVPSVRGTIHAFSGLLGMENGFSNKKKMKEIATKYPDAFPLVNGKRRPDMLANASGGDRAQPCTSNKDTIRIMGDNLAGLYKRYGLKDFTCTLGNNDGTIWCECASCVALDGKGKSYNYPENRYWIFVNALAARVYKDFPGADVRGWAYQNFHNPPTTVKPDKRLTVQLVFNRRCQRHTLTDKNCPINKVFLKNFTDWSKFPNKKFTWEQFNYSGANYMPMENTFVEDLYTYYKLGVNGCMLVCQPPDGIYSKARYGNTTVPYVWRNMWQTLYLSASILWDIKTDKNALLEKINSLYYGKAWNNGMKEYRTLLDQAARNTPGCFGHGLNSPAGRCLDHPGVHVKLLKALDKAEKAAKDDPRSLAHVKMDRKLFQLTWEAKRKEYLNNFRDFNAFPRTAPIKIDGKLNEKDWKAANIITNFQTGKNAEIQQTFARIVYDNKNLYIAADLMEETPGKMKETPKNLENIWRSNTFEFFLHQPELGGEYLHISFAPGGQGYLSYRDIGGNMTRAGVLADVEYKCAVGKDRWTVECRIPASVVGMSFTKGSSWKLNIGRGRHVKGEKAQYSSICNGKFQGSGSFHPLLLTEARVITSNGEKVISFWKNPSLNVTQKLTKWSNWRKWEVKDGLVPSSWHPGNSKPGKLAVVKKAGSTDSYLQFTGSASQFYGDKSEESVRLRIRIRAAGKGKMSLGIPRYKGKYRFCGADAKMLKGPNPVTLTEDFKDYTWEYTKRPGEFFALTIASSPDGEIKLDDAVITPVK